MSGASRKMRSDRQLRRWYRDYNRRYFGGRLPVDTVCYYSTVDHCYGDCACDAAGRFTIRVNPDITSRRCSRRFTLLHEMAHVAVWPRRTHGKYFDSEMLRLANAGALKGLW